MKKRAHPRTLSSHDAKALLTLEQGGIAIDDAIRMYALDTEWTRDEVVARSKRKDVDHRRDNSTYENEYRMLPAGWTVRCAHCEGSLVMVPCVACQGIAMRKPKFRGPYYKGELP